MVVAPFIPLFPFIKYPLSRYLQEVHYGSTPYTLQEEGRGGPGPGVCGAEIPSKHPPRTSALVRGVGQRRRAP